MNLFPAPGYAHLGIDDCGDPQGGVVGWVAVRLDSISLERLRKRADEIKKKYELQCFHGREYKPQHVDAYRQFMRAIKESLIPSTGRIRMTLTSRQNQKEFEGWCKEIIEGMITGQWSKKDIKDFTKPGPSIFWIAHEHNSILEGIDKFFIELDRLDVNLDLDQEKALGLKSIGVIGKKSDLLCQIVTALIQEEFKKRNVPRGNLQLLDIKVVDSKDSVLVQAADVFANFSWAQLKSKIDRTKSGRPALQKVKILEEVFDIYQGAKFDLSHLYMDKTGKLFCKDPQYGVGIDIFHDRIETS